MTLNSSKTLREEIKDEIVIKNHDMPDPRKEDFDFGMQRESAQARSGMYQKGREIQPGQSLLAQIEAADMTMKQGKELSKQESFQMSPPETSPVKNLIRHQRGATFDDQNMG